MTATLIILGIVVVTALAFDFTNGFHDTANAMATSIATGALKPFTAVAISAALNLVGAFLSVNVAATVAKGIVNLDSYDLSGAAADSDGQALLMVVFTGLIGGILWNLYSWLLGLPSSSSHALFGGLIGAGFAAMGTGGVEWTSIMAKIIIPAVASPIIAALVSACATFLVYWVTNTIPNKEKNEHFRHGQIVTACLVSLAHGAGDAQKTMGVIFLALVASGHAVADARIPTWVIVACAIAIAAGTLSGGWRVIRTLGKGLVEIESPHGAFYDSRIHRFHPWYRFGPPRRGSSLGRGDAHGGCLAHYAALCCFRWLRIVVAGARRFLCHDGSYRCHRGLRPAPGHDRAHRYPLPHEPGRCLQRQ